MSTDPGFHVDTVLSGSVLGAGPDGTPDQVSAVLGAGYAENRTRRFLWRDYGAVECFWERDTARRAWQGTHFTVQAHRLVTAGPEIVVPAIRARYGDLPPVTPWDRLHEALAAHDAEMVEIPGAPAGLREYWQPDSLVSVLVAQGGPQGDVPDGAVYAITAPLRIESVAARRGPGDVGGVSTAALRAMLDATDEQRLRWLARRHPGHERNVNWWLGMFVLIGQQIRVAGPRRADWVRFRLWAIRHAGDLGVFTPADTAIRLAYCVGELRHHGLTDEVAAVLPPADILVADCLRHVPIGSTRSWTGRNWCGGATFRRCTARARPRTW